MFRYIQNFSAISQTFFVFFKLSKTFTRTTLFLFNLLRFQQNVYRESLSISKQIVAAESLED